MFKISRIYRHNVLRIGLFPTLLLQTVFEIFKDIIINRRQYLVLACATYRKDLAKILQPFPALIRRPLPKRIPDYRK